MGGGHSKSSKVQYYRSKTVALYCLFGISKTDSASLTKILEKVDSGYTQVIDVRKFAFLFCGTYQECIMFLWMKFNIGVFKVSAPELEEKTSKKEDDEEHEDGHVHSGAHGSPKKEKAATHDETSSRRGHDKKHASADEMFTTCYHNFLYFLLFLMSREENELVQWLFWVRYHLIKQLPSHDNLVELVDSVWGRQEKIKFKRNKIKKYVEKVIDQVEATEFCPKSITIVDLRSNGAWSTPIHKMRKTIIKKTLGRWVYWVYSV